MTPAVAESSSSSPLGEGGGPPRPRGARCWVAAGRRHSELGGGGEGEICDLFAFYSLVD